MDHSDDENFNPGNFDDILTNHVDEGDPFSSHMDQPSVISDDGYNNSDDGDQRHDDDHQSNSPPNPAELTTPADPKAYSSSSMTTTTTTTTTTSITATSTGSTTSTFGAKMKRLTIGDVPRGASAGSGDGFEQPMVLQSRPTQSIDPHPSPPTNRSTLPCVEVDDIAFEIGESFPVSNGSLLVQYYPITISVSYYYTLDILPSDYNSKIQRYQKLTGQQSSSLSQTKQTYEWTICKRFSEFVTFHDELSRFYAHIPARPPKSTIEKQSVQQLARKRRALLQDLIYALYNVPFIRYMRAFHDFFSFPDYIYLLSPRPLQYQHHDFQITGYHSTPAPALPVSSMDEDGKILPPALPYTLAGPLQPPISCLSHNDIPRLDAGHSINDLTIIQEFNTMITPFAWLGHIQTAMRFNFFKRVALAKEVAAKSAYGGAILWKTSGLQSNRWEISGVIALDIQITTSCVTMHGKTRYLYLGTSNGQILQYNCNDITQPQLCDVKLLHENSPIASIYCINQSILSIARDGSIIYDVYGHHHRQEYHLNESLLSCTMIADRWLLIGTDSGYIATYLICRDDEDYSNLSIQQSYHPGLLLVGYSNFHKDGIRCLSHTNNSIANIYINNPYQIQQLHSPYDDVQYDPMVTSSIHVGDEDHPTGDASPAANETKKQRIPKDPSIERLVTPVNSNYHISRAQQGNNEQWIVITSSHDGKSKILLFTSNNPSSVTLREIHCVETRAASANTHLENGFFAIADHGGSTANISIWNSYDVKSGPYAVIDAHSSQITKISYDERCKTLISVGRDGHLKSWDIAHIVKHL